MSGRIALLAALSLIVLGVGRPVSAADSEKEGQTSSNSEKNRWETALTFDVLLHDWEAEGALDTFVPDCSESPCGTSLSGTQSSSTSSVQYRLGVELSSPRLEFLPAAPRAAVFGGLLINPQQLHSIFKEGRFVPKMPDTQVNAGFVPPFAGVVAAIEARYVETGWFVGVGAIFEVPALSSKIRFTPSVGYLRERIEVSGQLSAVNVLAPPSDSPPGSRPYPYVSLHAQTDWRRQTYHYLGPGAEIEILLIPGRRLSFSFYGQAEFLWNLNASSTVMVSSSEAGSTTFTYTPDDFAVRGAIGVRLGWQGGFGF